MFRLLADNYPIFDTSKNLCDFLHFLTSYLASGFLMAPLPRHIYAGYISPDNEINLNGLIPQTPWSIG